MVVAVLDTGLDLEWSTYRGDNYNANITGIRRVHEAFRNDSFKNLADVPEFVRYDKNSVLNKLNELGNSLHAIQLKTSASKRRSAVK